MCWLRRTEPTTVNGDFFDDSMGRDVDDAVVAEAAP
jgi:hypothetical protein